MADISTIELRVDTRQALSQTRKLDRNLNNLQRASRTTGRNLTGFTERASSGFSNLTKAVGGLAGAIGVGGLVKSVGRVSAEFEDLQTSLEAVFGSAEEAEDAFERIQDFSTKTPFSVQQLTEAMIQLKAQGIEPTNELLTTFGDAASVTTDKVGAFQAMVKLTARTAQGGLGLEEIEQLGDRGVPVLDILNERLGLTRDEISEFGKSAEGAAKITQALFDGVNQRFGGAMAESANNLSTVMSNLTISVENFLFEIGEAGLASALKNVTTVMTETINNGSSLATMIGTTLGGAINVGAEALRLLANNIQTVSIALGSLAIGKTIGLLAGLASGAAKARGAFALLNAVLRANPIIAVATAISAVIGGLISLVQRTNEANGINATFFETLRAIVSVIGDRLSPVIDFITRQWARFTEVIGQVGDFFKRVINNVIASVVTFKDATFILLDTIGNAFVNTFTRIGRIAKEFGSSLVDFVLGGFDSSAFDSFFGVLNEEFTTGFGELGNRIKEQADKNFNRDFVGQAGESLRAAGVAIREKVDESLGSFSSDVADKLSPDPEQVQANVSAAAQSAIAAGQTIAEGYQPATQETKELNDEQRAFITNLQETNANLRAQIATVGEGTAAAERIKSARQAETLGISEQSSELLRLQRNLQEELSQKQFNANFEDYKESIREEIELLKLSADERRIQRELLRFEQSQKEDLSESQRNELEALLRKQEQAREAAQERARAERESAQERQRTETEAAKTTVETERQRQREIERTGTFYEKVADDAQLSSRRILDSVVGAIEGEARAIRNLVVEGANLLLSVFKNINTGGGLGNIFSGLFSSFGGFFADGGRVNAREPIVVGERGPELFVPPQNGSIVPNETVFNNTRQGGFSVGSININIDGLATGGLIQTDEDIEEFASVMINRVRGEINREFGFNGALYGR